MAFTGTGKQRKPKRTTIYKAMVRTAPKDFTPEYPRGRVYYVTVSKNGHIGLVTESRKASKFLTEEQAENALSSFDKGTKDYPLTVVAEEPGYSEERLSLGDTVDCGMMEDYLFG